ncbi:MAG: hypothetical protein QG622_173 [Actinomycetota bacterium]|nr:hypothetical protein [Actinomycetota bacterium]
MSITADERAAFLVRQREISRRRYDDLHNLHYDELWGEVEPMHGDFVRKLVRGLPRPARVLDAACGTGKYWPLLIGAGARIVGVDHSTGMLAQARRKHPEIAIRSLALQDLARADDLAASFDAVLCVDAMEFVGPEDWPVVLEGFARTLRDDGLVYLTVEQPELDDEPGPPADPRQLPGESLDGGGYHHFPTDAQVRAWLTGAGFDVLEHGDAEWYWHYLVQLVRAPGEDAGPA